MTWQLVIKVVVLTAAYGLIVNGSAWLLRRAGAPSRWAIVLGFLTVGFVTGLLAAWAWPYDSCVLPNVWAVLLGDALYQLSSERLGDLATLRPPCVYPWAGAGLYSALGLIVQAFASRGRTSVDAEGPLVQA
jgi:hypothetical protein